MTGTLPWIFGLALRGRTRALARLGCWSVLELAPAYLSGIAVARALDDGFLAGRASTGLTWLAVLAAGAILGSLGTHRSMLCLADIVEPVRDRLMEVVVEGALDQATAPRPTAGVAGAARLTQQAEIVREALAGTLSVFRGFAIATVAVVAGLASLQPWLMLIVGPPLLAALVGLVVVVRAQVSAQRAQILAEEEVAESASRVASGLRDVVACGAEADAHRLVGRHVDAHAAAARRSARVKAMASLVVGVGAWLPLALLFITTPRLLRDGVTAGVIVGALVYLANTLQPAVQTLVEGLTGTGAWLVTAAGRIRATSRLSTMERGGSRTDAPERYEIRLRGIGFRYGPHSDPVLDGVDLTIPEGDHLAIAGPSGAGKSTLAGLVCGTLCPTAGEVTLGGVPLRAFAAGAIAAQRIAIPQEAYVFAGTLRENFTYHSGDLDVATIAAAAAAIGVAPLVCRLGGYDVEVEPDTLSAGERQLVALTRAYLSPARIAILDEATCHLDPAAEARVERAFVERPGTLVVVAHRISSALRARRILVLDGRTLQIGDHESLLLSSPLYQELVGRWHTSAVTPA